MAGWKPQVKTIAFVKRGFVFQGAPDGTLGFKMLKDEAGRITQGAGGSGSTAAGAKRVAEGEVVDSPNGAAASASSSSGGPAGSSSAEAVVLSAGDVGVGVKDGGAGTTPATGLNAAGKRQKKTEEGDEAGGMPMGGEEVEDGGAEEEEEMVDDSGGATQGVAAAPRPPAVEFEEVGDIMNLGRVTNTAEKADGEAEEEYVPVASKYEEEIAANWGPAKGEGEAEGEEDDLDATMAELLA